MKIKCQEHYENTVKYAKSIGDETLSKCIEGSSNGRSTPMAGMKSNCTPISHHIHSVSLKWRKTGQGALSEGFSITASRIGHLL